MTTPDANITPETTIHARVIPPDPVRENMRKTSSFRSLGQHPAGNPLLLSSGFITGLALIPLILDQIDGTLFFLASGAARSVAPAWPTVGEPWLWPSWVATAAFVVGSMAVALGLSGLKMPDVVVLAFALVLTATAARATWSTFTVVNAHLWQLIPVCVLCLLAFVLAATAAVRWRRGSAAGTGRAIGSVIGAWVAVTAALLAGTAIVQNVQKQATGSAAAVKLGEPWLLSSRAVGAPTAQELRGHWVPQVSLGQVKDEATAVAFATRDRDWSLRFPVVLVRADDLHLPGKDETWWLTLVDQRFDSPEAAQGWCSSSGLAPGDCGALQVPSGPIHE